MTPAAAARRSSDDERPSGRQARRSAGRARRIRTAIDAAIAGRGRLVLVQGAAARRRLDDAVAQAGRGPVHVARARCMPGDASVAPWSRIVASLGAAVVVPAARDRSRFERFAEILETLRVVTRDVPAVVVLEDLHHADRDSLLLLEMLARTLPHQALVVVAAHRDVSALPGHPLAETLAELVREPATVRLGLRASASPEASTRATAEDAVFRRVGDGWTIAFHGAAVRLGDSHGLRYLAVLLGHPWERIPVQVLHAAAEPIENRRRRKPVSAERARLAVTKAIKTALARIAIAHPSLAGHLGATVRRGHFCSYTPDPRHPVAWET